MKEYPSILGSKGKDFREFDSYVFDKIDGSNLRWEWARKSGWYKNGTRTRLFDESDPVFGCAVEIFKNTLSEPLEKIAKDNRWDRCIVFTEFCGNLSFAGKHVESDSKYLTVIDIAPYKKGILGPKEFLKLCGNISIPNFLGCYKWNRNFVEEIREGKLEGITFEGVVGKAGESHKLIMRKAKTQAWIDKVLAQYGEIEGAKIIES